MTTPFYWSFSALQDFEGCAARYAAVKIDKTHKFSGTFQKNFGNDVHKAIEMYLLAGKPLPVTLEQFEALLGSIAKISHSVEYKFGIRRDWTLTKPGARDAWFRGSIDLAALDDGDVYIIDWKTGKKWNKPDQLAAYAAAVDAIYPDVKTVNACYVWLKTNEMSFHVFDKAQRDEFRKDFSWRADYMEKAIAARDFKPRTSKLCLWCPVLQAGNCVTATDDGYTIEQAKHAGAM